MSLMVLDMMDLSPNAAGIQTKPLLQFLADVVDLGCVLQTITDRKEAGTLGEDVQDLLQEIRVGIPVDGDVVKFLGLDPGRPQTVPDRLGRQPGPVLDSKKPLFFHRSDQPSINDDGRRRILASWTTASACRRA